MSSFQDIINQDRLVLVNFYTANNEPSQHLNNILDLVHTELGDDVPIVKIDVEEQKSFAVKMMIQDVPTIVIFKDGEEIWRENSVPTVKELIRVLEKAM